MSETKRKPQRPKGFSTDAKGNFIYVGTDGKEYHWSGAIFDSFPLGMPVRGAKNLARLGIGATKKIIELETQRQKEKAAITNAATQQIGEDLNRLNLAIRENIGDRLLMRREPNPDGVYETQRQYENRIKKERLEKAQNRLNIPVGTN